jgi:hypothetical protein
METLARVARVAIIDGRPNHPEDYIKGVQICIDRVGIEKTTKRIDFLFDNYIRTSYESVIGYILYGVVLLPGVPGGDWVIWCDKERKPFPPQAEKVPEIILGGQS